jgi:GT2 family glycosyltransferase
VDVVIVSYNSAGELRDSVSPLAGVDSIRVIIVDNASQDATLDRVADLDVVAIPRSTNDGFAVGCNVGWQAGDAPYVCFLNPDASLTEEALRELVAVLEADPALAVAAPLIREADGTLAHSMRRFPRIGFPFARSVFLHRLFPRASWVDEVVRDEERYRVRGAPDWVSGACLVVRRAALEAVGGWDEGFFLYGEDVDLCRRFRSAGWAVSFEPAVSVRHLGGRSAFRPGLLPVLAESRLRYARKYRSPLGVAATRVGLTLEALTHLVVSSGGLAPRAGHLHALKILLGRTPWTPRDRVA